MIVALLQLISAQLGCEPDDICDFELQACDTQKSIIGGALKEFIFSGRLDNLCMSFCSLQVCHNYYSLRPTGMETFCFDTEIRTRVMIMC